MTTTALNPLTAARELVDDAQTVVDAALKHGAAVTEGGRLIDDHQVHTERLAYLATQVRGRHDAYDVDAGRVGQGHVGRDEGDLRTAQHGGAGERDALQPGGPVAEEADRVEVLPRAAGGDDHLAAREVEHVQTFLENGD